MATWPKQSLYYQPHEVKRIRKKISRAFPGSIEAIQAEALKVQATDREPRKQKKRNQQNGKANIIKPRRTDTLLSKPSRSVVNKSKRS